MSATNEPGLPRIMHVTTVDLTAWCFLRSVFRFLRAREYPVTLACTVSKFREDLEATGAEVVDLPIARRISPWQDLQSLVKLIKLIKAKKPQIVHTHTSKAGFLGRLAATICGVPHVIHTVHELPQNSTQNYLKGKFYWLLEYIAAKMWCQRLVTVSQPNYEQILREGIATPKNLTLIREGLDLAKYRPYLFPEQGQNCIRSAQEIRREFGIPEGAPFLCSVGRLEAAKGHSDLLEAFSLVLERFPQARLVIVGAGQLQAELQTRLEQLHLQNKAVLAGWRDDMLDILSACDYYALASHYEGLGVATLEAMALAKPVVCTGVGGVLDVVVEGETGFMVPPRRPDLMAARLCQYLQNPQLAQKMAQAGYRRVQEHFDDQKANQAMLELYQKVMRD